MKVCIHSVFFSGIVHQGGRSVAECGHVSMEMRVVGGLSVYITQYSGRSACLPMVTVSFSCPGMFAKNVTCCLAAVSRRSLPLMFVGPLILCSIVGRPTLILCWSLVTMAVMRGL
jgi:hypothetical protein